MINTIAHYDDNVFNAVQDSFDDGESLGPMPIGII
jgi:hypothetical protein